MKLLNKLALATAVAALSTASFAMEAMTDDSMAATTGQDGISIRVDTASGLTADKILIHDNDGGSPSVVSGTADAGAIIVNNLNISDLGLQLDIDADGNGGAPILEVGVTIDPLDISIGDISVGDSGTLGAAGTADANVRGATDEALILQGLSVSLGTVNADLQLGNELAGGAFATIDSNIGGGITLSAQLVDNNGGSNAGTAGILDLGTINITDSNSADLAVNATVNVDSVNGLEITNISSGTQQVYITDFGFNTGTANATTIGDIEIVGLNTGNTTISVAGK